MWEFNIGTPIGRGSPSIENGMLLVPRGNHIEATNSGSYIIAFDLPKE
jgi:hypothetical protein